MTTMREWRHRRIEAMGVTLSNAKDMADGSTIVVIDEGQFERLIAFIDAQLTQAVQSREIQIRVETLTGEAVETLVGQAYMKGREAERESIRDGQAANLQRLREQLGGKP